MDFFRTYAKELFALLVPVLSAGLGWLSRSRVKLTYATPHGFTFLVQEPLRDAQGAIINPTQTVHTRSFWFRNAGRATAHNLELVFNWKPPCVNVWPSRHVEENTEPDNRFVMTFGSLAPDEQFVCEVLSVNRDLPALLTVRCDEGVGRPINMQPVPVVSMARVRLLLVLAFIGAVAAIYLLLVGLQWLVLRTPSI